jgi:RecA-family ATPase
VNVHIVRPDVDWPNAHDVADLVEAGWNAFRLLEFITSNGTTLDEFEQYARRRSGEGRKSVDELSFTTLSEVKSVAISWLWPGRFPAGKICDIQGDPGTGKSLVSLDIAGRVSTGTAWPDSMPGAEPGDVILLSAEDDLADTIRPRVEAAGGDPNRIHAITSTLTLPGDVEALRAEIRKHNAKLVVIDPLDPYLAESVDAHKNASVRRVLARLRDLATDTGATILLVRHLNKDGKTTNAAYRGREVSASSLRRVPRS